MRTWIRSALERPAARRATPAVVLLAAGAMLMGAGLGDGSGARGETGGTAPGKRTIATATSNGWRVKLVAYRDGTKDPPVATVRISAFRRSHGEWDRLGRSQLVGSRGWWFWRTVTRRFGVRQLALRMPGGRFPLRVVVRLLRSPSLGASARFRFVVEDGRLVPVDV